MPRLAPVFHHRDARAQYYAVDVSDEGVLALGRSDGSVRTIDTRSKARGSAPTKLPLPRTHWVESVVVGDGFVLATSSVAHAVHRIDLASGAVTTIDVHGAARQVALRGGVVGLAAGNCVAGRVDASTIETPSYCGMPWNEHSYGGVALSADGTRIAAMRVDPRWRSTADGSGLARFDVDVLINEVRADPPWKEAQVIVVPVSVRAGRELPLLGWLGGAPALLEEQGVVLLDGPTPRRTPWPSRFLAKRGAWAADHAVAIDEAGTLAIAASGELRVTSTRVEPPWANVALSPNGRLLAYAAGFAQSCVFEIPGSRASPRPRARARPGRS